jgi:hypothetical protein
MKPTDIKIGKTYEVASGRNKTKLKVKKFSAKNSSWECETETGKTISVKDAKRFLCEVVKKPAVKPTTVKVGKPAKIQRQTPLPKTPREDGTVSGLEAAFIVLKDAGEALTIGQIMEQIEERGLAKLNGKTPAMTVRAAIQMEIKKKGAAARFVKISRGLFKTK